MAKNTPGAFGAMKKLFPVTKTIAFNLVPVGKALEHMRANGVLKQGDSLSDSYFILKDAADLVHKEFIEKTLAPLRLKHVSDGGGDSLQEYAQAYFSTALEKKEKEKVLEEIGAALKKQIGAAFAAVTYTASDEEDAKEIPMLKAFSGRALIKELLDTVPLTPEQRAAREVISTNVTYMRPYFEARDRIYSANEGGHTIPVRIVEDNLPIHLNNIQLAKTLPEEIFDRLTEDTAMADYLKDITGGLPVRDVFTVSYACGLLAQSAIDAYNTLIGGFSSDAQTKHKGLNELINEYEQTHPEKRLHKFEKLQKQILSDRSTPSWVPVALKEDNDVLTLVDGLKDMLLQTFGKTDLSSERYNPSPENVLIDMKRIGDYSHRMYGNWKEAENGLKALLRERNPRSARQGEKGYAEKIKSLYKKLDWVSVADIDRGVALAGNAKSRTDLQEFIRQNIVKPIVEGLGQYNALKNQIAAMPGGQLTEKLGQSSTTGKIGAGQTVKLMLDLVNDAVRTAKLFACGDASTAYDKPFYEKVIFPLKEYAATFIPNYNSIRNYLTKKPYSKEKIRLTFGKSSFLQGWDANKMDGNGGILLSDGKEVYLCVLNTPYKKLTADESFIDENSSLRMPWERKLKGAHMSLPGTAFGKKAIPRSGEPYCPSDLVYDIYCKTKTGELKVKDYTPQQVAAMIDFYKKVIRMKPEWEVFNFRFKDTAEYARLNDFFMDFNDQASVSTTIGVRKDFFLDANEKGLVYLFRVTCQDMSDKHHGKDGDYKVLLMEALSGKGDPLVKIMGGANIYYRKASLKKKVTHPAGEPMAMKNPATPAPTRTLPYDLYKDRRYMEDRFAFHVPVKIYPDADAKGAGRLNATVQEVIKQHKDMYVLGINRGERNLISIAVTAPDGTIVEQRNLNVFDGYDYRAALARRSEERRDDRQNWDSVRDIKNLKKGYLSRVVGEIVRLVRKYNCIVALEQLDPEFKNSRKAFENSIYEQFERDLVGKLGLMTDKDDPNRFDSALQLCDPSSSEIERTKFTQNGIIFFMKPNFVSMTDPRTGFVNRVNTAYKNVAGAEELMSRMDAFVFDRKKGRFCLSFRYANVTPDKETGDAQRVWTVETYGDRIKNILSAKEDPRGRWKDEPVNLTNEMKDLFNHNGINWSAGEDILPQLQDRGAEFWKALLRLLRLTLCNTSWDSKTKEFRVVGCTADENGYVFDSRSANESAPLDADILAAWNIARKAHLALERVREFVPKKKNDWPLLSVNDKDWFESVQKDV